MTSASPYDIQEALRHHQAGRLPEAEVIYQKILQVNPHHLEALQLLAMIAHQRGNNPLAIEWIGKAIRIQPSASMYFNLGFAYQTQGNDEAAADSYRKALALEPRQVEAHANLGNVLQALGRFDEAIEHYRKALALQPDLLELCLSLGHAFKNQGKLDAAVESYRKALVLRPEFAEAYSDLGCVLHMQDRFDAAIESCLKALELKPDFADAHRNLSLSLKMAHRYAEALQHAQRAAQLHPGVAGDHQSIAMMLGHLSDYAKVVEHSDAALALKKDDYRIWENRLYMYSYHPDLRADQIFAEFIRWGDRFPVPAPQAFAERDRGAGRRLRIGYVSPDFRRHTSRFFFEPLFAHHDHGQVELFAYANVKNEDIYTERFKGLFDQWRDIRDVSDLEVADLVRRDGIDILVDCCNHMVDDRLDVFIHKPAPIQVTWLGAAWTTGLSMVDYVLFDRYLAPQETLAREKIVRLPGCFVAYRPPQETADVAPPPALENGYLTFGYSGRTERLNHKVFRAWGEILRRLPEARLILDFTPFADTATQDYYRGVLTQYGIDVSRVTMRNSANIFAGLNDIDILLDCFPHSGGTMLFDALWMGVPAVTLASRPPVGRIGTSLMSNIGLQNWVAKSEEEYIEKAVGFAADIGTLRTLRAGMRDRMKNSPLMDEAEFARGVEAAYRTMWQRWCNALPAMPIGAL